VEIAGKRGRSARDEVGPEEAISGGELGHHNQLLLNLGKQRPLIQHQWVYSQGGMYGQIPK
jgi:hypothetical protein